MASGKRQPSKRKRSSQNRQQRAALQVRKEAAQAPPVVRPAPVPKPAPVVADTPAATPAAAPREPKTSLLGRLRDPSGVKLPASATGARTAPEPVARERPTVADAARSGRDKAVAKQAARSTGRAPSGRTTPSRASSGRTTASTAAPAGSRRAASAERMANQPVGYRAAVTALMLTVAAALLAVFSAVAVDHHGDLYTPDTLVTQWAVPALHTVAKADHPTATKIVASMKPDDWAVGRQTKRVIVAQWPVSAAVALPIIGSFLVFQSVRRRRSARVVTRAMYATVLGSLLTSTVYGVFFPEMIAIGAVFIASYQVRKAETAALQAEAGDVGDVIDADVVDD